MRIAHRIDCKMARYSRAWQKNRCTDSIRKGVLPTLLDLTGKKSSKLDGSSFAGVLKGKIDSHRKFFYGMHNNFSEVLPYPTRTISDGDFRLILNLTPNELFIEKHLMGLKGTLS